MKHLRFTCIEARRLLALALLLVFSFTQAHADEYADVAQLLRAGRLPEALIRAEMYLTTKPRDPQMRFLKGVIQRDSGETMDAIFTFTRLAEDFPELPEPYNNLAVLHAGQRQYDKARAALEMAIRVNPNYATAYENLGDVHVKLASEAYNKALQLDEANTGVSEKLTQIRDLFNPKVVSNQRPEVAPIVPPLLPAPAVAIAARVATPPNAGAAPAPTSNNAGEAKNAVLAWANAWAARDVKAYLAAYGKDFIPPNALRRSAWEQERSKRIISKPSISIELENLTVAVSGADAAVAKFRQHYKAGGLTVSSRKTLELVKRDGHWQIVKESSGS